ncbi:hypothetical protein [Moorena sp. SIO3H5]|uniref:hypothetical protein n=1 Tax=Moorena sp. SIO3H5 TaxID=2607834 RepID=UPI0013BB81CA|nr:hypothetical protein [Moorena sp. SIO3H5]NEO70422.1 hypothetical protein [Moorena sp. SIO3H5]
MTKLFPQWMIVPITLAVSLSSAGVVSAETINLQPEFQPDPIVVSGNSGGSNKSQCGMISTQPNHVINLNQDFTYLRFNLKSQGQPTLLIQEPNGTSCTQADNLSGANIVKTGYWEQGSYSFYVGDRNGEQHPYTLSITKTP